VQNGFAQPGPTSQRLGLCLLLVTAVPVERNDQVFGKLINHKAWWCAPVSPVFWRLRQEDRDLKASLAV
jgi:hypothetical protein